VKRKKWKKQKSEEKKCQAGRIVRKEPQERQVYTKQLERGRRSE
jgi:hypothetical protein